MTAILGTLTLVLASILLAFSAYALVMGLGGWFMGERFERCPRCHRHGLTTGGVRHGGGCPESFVDQLAHPNRWSHGADLRHH